MRTINSVISAFTLATALTCSGPALADTICTKSVLKKGKIVTSTRTVASGVKCPKGFVKIFDTNSLPINVIQQIGAPGPQGSPGAQGSVGQQGPQGITGAPGTDGSIRIYGDGSDGDVTVSTNTTLSAIGESAQFRSLTIQSGKTLIVPSGTVLRIQQNFSNSGTITILPGASGGGIGCNGACSAPNRTIPFGHSPETGVSVSPASTGDIGSLAVQRVGGSGGVGLAADAAQNLYYPGMNGGGGGFIVSGGTRGFKGGGSLVILAGGTLRNESVGKIVAPTVNSGTIGTGGNGGGVLVVASKTSIVNDGVVEMKGSNGVTGGFNTAGGGGGGGGIIRFIAPTVTSSGTADVSGGAGSAAQGAGTISGSIVVGGAGGGGSGGNGGGGSAINTDGSTFASAPGGVGHFLITTADPTSLF